MLLSVCFGASAESLPTVVVLSTGGTIASKHDLGKGGYVPDLTGEDLVAAVPSARSMRSQS